MHRIVESIEDNKLVFFLFFLQYRRRERGKHVRRLKRSTAAESKRSCKVGDPHVSVCFYLSHQMAREAYNNAIQRAEKMVMWMFVL
jgi:hypothetical protein